MSEHDEVANLTEREYEACMRERDKARAEADRLRLDAATLTNSNRELHRALEDAQDEAERLRGIMQGYVWGMEAAVREGEVKQTVADGLLHATRAALEAGKA